MRSARLACLVAAVCVPFLVAPSASHGATVDYFLNLEGIEGESNAQGFENQIDVLSYAWGVSREDNKPVFQDLSVTKRVDSSSPELLVRAASGRTIPTAELTARRAGEQQLVFLTFCLTNVVVTSVQSSGGAGDAVPNESVTLAYSTITEVYRPQNPDGSAGQPIVGGWDLVRKLQTGAAC